MKRDYRNYGAEEVNGLRGELIELRTTLFRTPSVPTDRAVVLSHAVALLKDYAGLLKGKRSNDVLKGVVVENEEEG